jgi:succinyldiaminopimelate transaminase
VAQAHPAGIVDLSVGTPVDPTPAVVREALAGAADAPGYPTTAGSVGLTAAITGWLRRRCGVGEAAPAVLPTLGSKELVAWLPTLLGLGPGDMVGIPSIAYPTYRVGVVLAGAGCVLLDQLADADARIRLLWLNSPANPTGRVLSVEELRATVAQARERNVIVASDECYLEFGWDAEPVSILDSRVCDGEFDGLLAVHSLSKRSAMAGYRAGFVAGDPALVRRLHEVRRHAGMMVSAPVQAAMVAALDDQAHVNRQREWYRHRRDLLVPALGRTGFAVEHSEAGLYLWARHRDLDGWGSVAWLADRGILVAPGDFYGEAGSGHIRVALTAPDERIQAAAARLASST